MPNNFSTSFIYFQIGFLFSRLYIFSVSVINYGIVKDTVSFLKAMCLIHCHSAKIGDERSFLLHFSHPREHIYCVRKYILKYQQLVTNDLLLLLLLLVFFVRYLLFFHMSLQGLRGFKLHSTDFLFTSSCITKFSFCIRLNGNSYPTLGLNLFFLCL